MNEHRLDLNSATFRPMWLRGGPDAACELKRRYPERPLGLDRIHDAIDPDSIARAAETNVSHVIIPFDGGFPPETCDSAHFPATVELLHDQGLQALAAIRVSSAVRSGSREVAPWFARTARGKLVRHSGLDRFMTCLNRPQWREHIKESIQTALDAGADGVFFEEVAFGAVPSVESERFHGDAGCRCEICRESFQKSKGNSRMAIPRDLSNPVTRLFFEWRAGVASDFIAEMSAFTRSADPSAITILHAHALTAGPAFLWFGTDVASLSQHVDVIIEENNHLPHFSKRGLIYDTPSLLILQAQTQGALPGSLPRRWGAGFDPVPAANLHLIPIAEAVGCRAVHIVNACEGWNQQTKSWEILTETKFHDTRTAIGRYYNWLEKNEDLFQPARQAASAALLLPADAWKWKWCDTSRVVFKILQTLVELHIPVRVITEEQLDGVADNGVRAIVVPTLEGVANTHLEALQEFAADNALILVGDATDEISAKQLSPELFTQTAERRSFLRKIIDRLPTEFPPVLAEPVVIPERWQEIFDTVREAAVPGSAVPVIEGAPFIQAHAWRTETSDLVFIVNHVPGLADLNVLSLRHPRAVSTRILSPDIPKITYSKDASVSLRPTIFTVVETKDPFRRSTNH